jgi:hypothetical protein
MVMEIINNTMSATKTVRDVLMIANFIKAPRAGSFVMVKGEQYTVVAKTYAIKRIDGQRVKRTRIFVSATGV